MWICPTFQRPERLAELAYSWERCEPETPLAVRIWENDPKKEEYLSYAWPTSWRLYVAPEKGAGEVLNAYFREFPNESFYGFIGDDIVLRTPGGLKVLEDTAKDWFVAYPNDVLQRHRLCTHFAVGGRFARALGFIVPPMFKHNYMDVGLANIASPLRLLRYCPQVVFQHKHFLVSDYKIAKDATYSIVYPGDATEPTGPNEEYGRKALADFEGEFHKAAVVKLYKMLIQEYELWQEWEDLDVSLYSSAG